MKFLAVALLLAAMGYTQCPLGFTPEEACSADSPSCALFTDANGDNLCDNPGPQPVQEDPEPEPELEPETEETTEQDPFCPLGYSPEEACSESSPGCALFTDSNGDGLCDNPGPQPAVEEEETQNTPPVEEPAEEETSPEITAPEEQEVPEENPIQDESQEVDTLLADPSEEPAEITEEESQEDEPQLYTCPLQFSPEEACFEESPSCALYTDLNRDGRCDNPGVVCLAEDTTCGLDVPSIIGCPLGLPPEGACPDSLALCPHWYGVTSNIRCANPSGGERRVNIVLITLGVLLPLSTFLSRKFYGRRLKDRLKRSTSHHVVRGVSLMILGFGVQGCFCPLGSFQYIFTAEGLTFLGVSGLVILFLPIVFSIFFGRIFCGWVCPMGAVQEFLYRIHVPGRISPSGRIHKKLRYMSHVMLLGIIALILMNRYGVIDLSWRAPFCYIDPFHTMFTLFLSGSLVIAGITMILAIFVRRFFCRYLCFYGAALSLCSKLRIWSRIKGTREPLPEMDSDEEFDK